MAHFLRRVTLAADSTCVYQGAPADQVYFVVKGQVKVVVKVVVKSDTGKPGKDKGRGKPGQDKDGAPIATPPRRRRRATMTSSQRQSEQQVQGQAAGQEQAAKAEPEPEVAKAEQAMEEAEAGKVVEVMGPGTSFGQLGVVTGRPRAASVQTMGEVVCPAEATNTPAAFVTKCVYGRGTFSGQDCKLIFILLHGVRFFKFGTDTEYTLLRLYTNM